MTSRQYKINNVFIYEGHVTDLNQLVSMIIKLRCEWNGVGLLICCTFKMRIRYQSNTKLLTSYLDIDIIFRVINIFTELRKIKRKRMKKAEHRSYQKLRKTTVEQVKQSKWIQLFAKLHPSWAKRIKGENQEDMPELGKEGKLHCLCSIYSWICILKEVLWNRLYRIRG